MKKLLLFPLVLGSCSHDLSAAFSAEVQNQEAMELFATADMVAARQAWMRVVDAYPNDPNALFGVAITDLMLMTESAPVTKLLHDHCHQAAKLDVITQLFGDEGLIKQGVDAAEGEWQGTVNYFGRAGEGAIRELFDPKVVKSEISGPPGWRQLLTVNMRERDVPEPRWIYISANIDDLVRGDEQVTPLVDGVEVSLDDLDGYFEVFARPNPQGYTTGPTTGRLRFVHAGLRPGEPLEIELLDIRTPAPLPEGCGGDCGPSQYLVSGRVSDHISARSGFDLATVPFGTVSPDAGPPRRDSTVVAIEDCDRIDDRVVAEHVMTVVDLIHQDAQRLGAILASPDRGDFDFAMPAKLFASPAALPVNLTDVRALRGLLLAGVAFAEMGAQYRWLAGDLQSTIEEHRWYFDDLPSQSRVLWPATLAAHLEAGFMTKPEGFDLTRARDRLRAGLDELTLAMNESPERPGLFDFQAALSARLVRALAGVGGAMAASFDSATPVMLPDAPLYGVHMKSFFDDPLDGAKLRQLSGVLRLFGETPGIENDPVPGNRNPELELEADVLDVRRWSGGLFTYPAIDDAIACDPATACPTGYTCRNESCSLDPPWFATANAWSSASRRDWPAFVSGALRDALAVDF